MDKFIKASFVYEFNPIYPQLKLHASDISEACYG
jgi:hypothetical protein